MFSDVLLGLLSNIVKNMSADDTAVVSGKVGNIRTGIRINTN